MARTRNIKPGFFTNDELTQLSALTRLLFAGLWTIADRAGRLEDRPRKIKLAVLPADKCDVDRLLQALHDHGFILRYQAHGNRYIQILAWDKHQNPHVKEVASTIPAPDLSGVSTRPAPEQHTSSRALTLPPLTNHSIHVQKQNTKLVGGGPRRSLPSELAENTEWDKFLARWRQLTGGDAGRIRAEKYFPEACAEVGFAKVIEALERYGESQLWHDGKIHDMANWFAEGKYRETPPPKRPSGQSARQRKIQEC